MTVNIKITEIVWDFDGMSSEDIKDAVGDYLPSVPMIINDFDEENDDVADILSDKFGFAVKGVRYEII